MEGMDSWFNMNVPSFDALNQAMAVTLDSELVSVI